MFEIASVALGEVVSLKTWGMKFKAIALTIR